MARVGGFEDLTVFLAKTARGVLIKTASDMGDVASAIGREVVPATPVDTGLARGNWQATLNIPASQANQLLDPSGAEALSRIAATVARITVDTTFHLVNRVAYINLLDAGHSAQAPPGFIREAVLRGMNKGFAIAAAKRLELFTRVGI